MPKCAVKKCSNNTLTTQKKDGVTYHRFPGHEIMKENWRKLIARERSEEFYKPNKSSVICSDHFLESDVYYTKKGYKRLKKTAVPHIQFTDDPGPSQPRKISIKETKSSQKLKPSQSQVLDSTDVRQEQHVINSPVRESTLSTPSGLSSILNTPRTSHFKKELIKCHRKIRFRDRQVRNLKKQNKRLTKANLSLKEIIQDLKKKRLINDSICNDIEKNAENDGEYIIKIEML